VVVPAEMAKRKARNIMLLVEHTAQQHGLRIHEAPERGSSWDEWCSVCLLSLLSID
jgi:hypothetical protein